MFYNLSYAQGIQTVVNTGTFFSSPILTPIPSPTPTVGALASVLEVGHLGDVVSTLTVPKLTSPLISTKKAWEKEQNSPRMEASPKQTQIYPSFRISKREIRWK